MALRKKPLPTRRGRARADDAAASAEAAGEAAADAEVAADEAKDAADAAGGGLEMSLIVATLLMLVAAFVLLQVEMRAAFGAGWPF